MATKFLDANGLKYVINKIRVLLSTKQDKLTFDKAPTSSSDNPVTSDGIKCALDGKLNTSGGTVTGSTTFQKRITLQDGITSSGFILINPNTTNSNEDMRLNENSTTKWATIYIGAPSNSISGYSADAWGITRTPNGTLGFYKGNDYTSLNNGLHLKGNGTALLGGKEVVKNSGTWDISINGTASKATQDANGNVISTTYAKKSDIPSVPIKGIKTNGATSNLTPDTSGIVTIPAIPTNISAFTNDSGYLTTHQDLSGYETKAEVSAIMAGCTEEAITVLWSDT